MKRIIILLNGLIVLLNILFLLRIDLDAKFVLGPEMGDSIFNFGLELSRNTEILVVVVSMLLIINSILVYKLFKKTNQGS